MLLDVIMETDVAGLELVEYIRNEIKNETVRIILRTGQPGQAPERRVIVQYDINDYKAKTELTADKLFTSLTAALRSYQQLERMVQTRRGLEIIIDAASTLYDFKSMQRLAEGVLTQLASLLNVDCAGILVLRDDGARRQRVFGARGLGLLQPLHRHDRAPRRSIRICAQMVEAAFQRRKNEFADHRSVLYLRTGSGREVVVLLQAERQLSDTDRALVEIFSSRLSIAFDNVILYQQLHEANTQLEDRVAQRTRALMQANRRLSAQWLRLQRANGFKNEILGTVAHDLKNPLGVILGRTEMLTELIGAGSPKENVTAQVEHIRDATKRLTSMVDHLISDAMADAFDITIRREPVDVAALVAEVTDANLPSAVNKQQTISVSAPPNIVTMCDADRIREAIDNLVSNAIKYSPIGGKITVAVTHEGRRHRDPHRRRGRRPFAGGSRPAVRPLPAAVGQADRRRKLDRPRPVDRQTHHRHAWRPCDRRQRRPRTGIDVYGYTARNRDVMTQSPHIIIVDDEAPAREMVGDYLKMHGFGVTLCDGGKSLRSAIETNVPDLVVLDLNMPEEDGLSIIRDLKSRINVPVIMLTATASPIDRVVGLELGADDYIAKPCELRELMARIRSVLRRSTPAKAAAAPEAAAAKAAKDQLVRFGTKWLDLEAQALRDDEGNEHPLTASEFGLLKVFAANPKRVLSRERLLELANARDAEAFDRAVDLRIMRIRRKIEIDPTKPAVIRTIRGGGYLFSPTGEKG